MHTIMNYRLQKMKVFYTTYSLILLYFLIRYLMDYFCLCKICTRYLTKINVVSGSLRRQIHSSKCTLHTLCHHFLNNTNNSMHCLHSRSGERIISSELWPPVHQIWMLALFYFWDTLKEMCKSIILTLKTIWNKAVHMYCLQFHQQNFNVQLIM